MLERLCLLLLLAVSSVPVSPAAVAAAQQSADIRFGVLPVLQALSLYVARDKGLFEKEGVRVELIPFHAAADKDIALTAKSIDGNFGDLLTTVTLAGNRVPVTIVATNYYPEGDRRMFAVLGKPGCTYGCVRDLDQVPVALSSHTVSHYVTKRLMIAAGVPEHRVQTIESKDIGLRMQMLVTGKVEAATLPEPLASAAVAKGAVLLADDSGIPLSQTVLIFSTHFLREHRSAVRGFLRAVDEANRLIDAQPESARAVMAASVRLPDFLKATYPVPRFPALRAPGPEVFAEAVEWLSQQGVLRSRPQYEQVVDPSLVR